MKVKDLKANLERLPDDADVVDQHGQPFTRIKTTVEVETARVVEVILIFGDPKVRQGW